MFTRNDYLEYFAQLREVEQKMAEKYRFLSDTLRDPELRSFFKTLYEEELHHDAMVESLAKPFLGN